MALGLARIDVLAISEFTAEVAKRAGAEPEGVRIVWPGCDSDFSTDSCRR